MLGIIIGSGLYESSLLKDFKEEAVDTAFGWVSVLKNEDVVIIRRHGKNKTIPPHFINNQANISALKSLGCKRIISFSSTGSLKKEIVPGVFVVPHDYIDFFSKSTIVEKQGYHVAPVISEAVREEILGACEKLGMKVIERGVYFQTTGPRLETKAEVKMISNFADVVGMTFGSEATIANELRIPIANISTVDNYANGLIDEEISEEIIDERRKDNFRNVEKLLSELIS